MELLKISGTATSPEIVFDADELLLSLSGVSRPEDVHKFYQPLITSLEEFHAVYAPLSSVPLNIGVKLDYYNSASFLKLIDIFRIIQNIHQAGRKIIIEWHYSEDDDLIRETGEEISEISELPFNFIED